MFPRMRCLLRRWFQDVKKQARVLPSHVRLSDIDKPRIICFPARCAETADRILRDRGSSAKYIHCRQNRDRLARSEFATVETKPAGAANVRSSCEIQPSHPENRSTSNRIVGC